MANKIGIVLALDGEQEFSQGMKNASQSAKNLQSDLKTLKNDFKENANSMEYLKQRQDLLKSSQDAYGKALSAAKSGLSHQKSVYKEQQKSLEELKKKLEQAKTEQQRFTKAGDTTSSAYKKSEKAVKDYEKAITKQSLEIQKSEGKLSQWEHTVNQAQHDVTACGKAVDQNARYLEEASRSATGCATSIDKYGKEVKEAGEETKSTATQVTSLKEKLGQALANKAMSVAVDAVRELGQKAIEAGKYVLDVGSSFEAAMSKVEALSGASGSELEALSQKAQMLGRTTQFSASEAADALSNMALAGWSTEEMLNGIDGVLRLAAAGGMDLASAADAVAGYLAAFNMKASESSKLADVMATAQAKSKTTTDQLAEAYGTCATNLTQAGQEMTTTTALLEGMASVNDTGSAAGTKLSAVMAQITQKMKDGKIAIGETKVAVTDSNGSFRDMVDIIADVEAATNGMTDAERASALQATFNRQSTAGMNELLSVGSERLRAYKSDLENSSGAAEAMAATMNDNLQGALKEAGSATEGLGIALYNKVSGPLTGAVRIATGLINGITDAITPQKTELESFIDDIETENERIDALLNAADSDVKNAEAKVSELEVYKNTILELQEVINNGGELDAFEVQEMKTAVESVKDVVPGIGDKFDEVTGKIRLSTAEIETMFTAAEQGLMQTAIQNALQQEMQAVADAKVNEARALAAVRKAEEEYNAYVDANPGMGENVYGVPMLDDAYTKLKNTLDSARNALADSTKETEKATDAYNETAEAARILEEEQTKLATESGDSATSTAALAKEQRSARNAMKESASAAGEAAVANEELAESEDEAAAAAEEAAKKVEAAHDNAAKAVKEAYDSAKKSAEEAFKVDPFKSWEQNQEEGIAKLQESLDSQIEGMTNYAQNLQTVSDHVGQEITPQFMQYLQDLGTDGAQVMQEMAEALESGDTGKVEAVMQSFTAAMDQRQEISTAMAANAVALQMGTKQMGSSAAEWDSLKDTIRGKIGSLGAEMSSKLESEFTDAAIVANRLGVAIPEGLIEGIESSDDPAGAVQNAIDQINAAVQGQLEGLVEVAKESGATLPKGLEEGIAEGTVNVTSAYTQLLQALSSVQSTTEAAGKEAGKTMAEGQASGVEESAGEVASAAEGAASDAASAAGDKASEFQSAGQNAADQYASGISSGQGNAVSAASSAASAARAAAASWESSWYSIGVNSAQGMAQGIQSQISSVASQAASLVSQAIAAAKAAGGIASPSKKFQDMVGKQIGAGTALGIKQSTKKTEKAAEYQMGRTLAAAQKWLNKNKKKIAGTGTDLEDAISYTWQSLGSYEIGKNFKISLKKTVKKGKKTVRKRKGAEEYYGEVYQAAEQYLQNVQALYDTTDEQELKYWQKVAKRLKKGTSAWYSAKKEIKQLKADISEAQAEAAEDAAKDREEEAEERAKKAEEKARAQEEKYNEILQNAEEYVAKQSKLNKMSIRSEIAYWRGVLKQLKKGSDQYKNVVNKIIDLKKQIGTIGVAENLLSNFETYYTLSERAEMQYWKEIRKHYKAGTAERITADQKYLEAKSAYRDKLKSIEDDYAAKIEETNAKYTDAVQDRKEAILGAFDLFDAFESSSATGKELLFNIKTQAAGYEEWSKSISELQNRKIFSDDLMKALTDKGPQDIASIKALLTLTDEELKEYQKAYDKKEKEASKQAAKENEGLKKTVEQEVADLKKQRSTEISEVKTGINSGLLNLATNIRKIAEDQASVLVAAFTAPGSAAPGSTGKSVNDKTVANAGATQLVNDARSAQGTKQETEQKASQPAAAKKTSTNKPETTKKTTAAVPTMMEEAKKQADASAKQISKEEYAARLKAETKIAEHELKKILGVKNLSMSEEAQAVSMAKGRLDASIAAANTAATKTSIAAKTTAQTKTQENNAIKKAINAGKSRKKTVTGAEKKSKSALWQHIVKKYGRTPTVPMYKSIGKVLGVTVSNSPTDKQRSSILKKLKARGLATGKKTIYQDGLAWIDENLDTKGPEMIVRKSDKAILTRLKAGDSVIPANLTSNLWKWGAIDPSSMATGAELNARLLGAWQAQTNRADRSKNDVLDALSGILGYLPLIAEGMHLSIDGRELAGTLIDYTSQGLARKARRRA